MVGVQDRSSRISGEGMKYIIVRHGEAGTVPVRRGKASPGEAG